MGKGKLPYLLSGGIKITYIFIFSEKLESRFKSGQVNEIDALAALTNKINKENITFCLFNCVLS